MNVKGKTILFVDDDSTTTLLYSKILNNNGYKVITAQNGENAIEAFNQNESIDLIIMDIDLGKGIDGADTSRIILEKRDIPIVFHTSFSDQEKLEKVRNISRYGFVIKNSEKCLLLSSVEIAFELFEKHKQDEIIRISEANLRKAEQIANIGSWTWNIKTNQLEFSDEMLRIFGIDKTSFDGTYSEVFENPVHPDDRIKVEHFNLSIIKEGKSFPNEYRVIWPDQSVHVISSPEGEIIFDNTSNPSKFFGTVQDITQRKLMENEIADRVKELECISAVLSELQNNLTVEEFCTRVIKHLTKALKFPEKTFPVIELSDNKYSNINNTDELNLGLFSDITAGEISYGKLCIYYSKNKHFFMPEEQNLANIIADHIGTYINRKQTEETIREKNAFNEHLLKNVPFGMDIVDHEGNILFVNENMESMFGKDLLGKKCFEIFKEDRKQCNSCPLKKNITLGKSENSVLKIGENTFQIEHYGMNYQSKPALLEIFQDITTYKHTEEILLQSNEELERRVAQRTRDLSITQEATINSMAILAEFRDPETGAHIQRTKLFVKLMLEKLADIINISPKDRDLIWLSAPLHDIGKVAIPDNILLKDGELMEDQFNQMKKHTLYGYDVLCSTEKILGENSFLNYAKEITKYHHEKWDGSGYPDGLKGEEIPLSARIMAIADVYDALVSERSYKHSFPHEIALDIIAADSGTHFDPLLVKIFVENHKEFDKIAKQNID